MVQEARVSWFYQFWYVTRHETAEENEWEETHLKKMEMKVNSTRWLRWRQPKNTFARQKRPVPPKHLIDVYCVGT